jgi:hypothetical protein
VTDFIQWLGWLIDAATPFIWGFNIVLYVGLFTGHNTFARYVGPEKFDKIEKEIQLAVERQLLEDIYMCKSEMSAEDFDRWIRNSWPNWQRLYYDEEKRRADQSQLITGRLW